MVKKSFSISLNSKIQNFNKKIFVDSDKSISIRSFLIGSICNNVSTVRNVLESDDVFSTIKCLKRLGVKIVKISPKKYRIFGRGLGSLHINKNKELNFGNSGTLARLLIGMLSTTPNINLKMRGDHSLNKRSMKKLILLMRKFGASFLPKKKYHFPLRLISAKWPLQIYYKSGISAQLKSSVILAGLNAYGKTKILEQIPSRNHTENMLAKNNKAIQINKKKKIINIIGKKSLEPINVSVPGDPSSAAFITALTLLNSNSSILIKNVGLNSTRIGFYKILKNHGAKIFFKKIKKSNSEIVGNIFVKSSKLKPIKASNKYYVSMTDEYPVLFIIASLIKGISVFNGIEDLANKESNRISEMQNILKQIGIKSSYSKNKLKIFGKNKKDIKKRRIKVEKLGDHRICMSSFVLSLLIGADTYIKNFDTVFTSSPSFLKIMKNLGANFEIKK